MQMPKENYSINIKLFVYKWIYLFIMQGINISKAFSWESGCLVYLGFKNFHGKF